MKKVVAACIDKIIDFDTREEAVAHMEKLRTRKIDFAVLQRGELENSGKYRVRIREQYNHSPLIND